MSNRLYLYHRPTGQFVPLAERGSFGWYVYQSHPGNGTPAERLFGALFGMLQRSANGLSLTDGHQDDFALVLDDASGAPCAQENFASTAPDDLDDFTALRALVGEGTSADEAAQERETNAIALLREENRELRVAAGLLVELMELRKIGERIMDAHARGTKYERVDEFNQRKALALARAYGWMTGLAGRLASWKKRAAN